MSAAETRIPGRYYCQEPGCESAYSTQFNLNRHVLTIHREKIREPCGVVRANHASNSRRHQKTCKKCREILSSPLTSGQQNGTGTPASAPNSTIQTPSHDAALNPYEVEIEFGFIENILECETLPLMGKLSANVDTKLTFN
ncbi:hypothetical protein CSIM01_00523 [Colletotrichum simmondsii]|uniref:C2H2-type domain-containing protein n=1 Tax=Colletotrichum simmondsii TaxID=703756 RepID=A0A135SIS8_9PEZI|nr:hypothetical protein CSIM01_00523 [Colletotrichum simmondsii]